jgi:hypothetical protein
LGDDAIATDDFLAIISEAGRMPDVTVRDGFLETGDDDNGEVRPVVVFPVSKNPFKRRVLWIGLH